MNDSQFEFQFTIGGTAGGEWQGVEIPAVPSPDSWTIAFGDAASSGGERAGCSAGSCPHPTAHPAEEEWQWLASAVPVPDRLHRFKPRCEEMAYPTEADFRSAVAAVRPESADEFSLQRLRESWTGDVAERVGGWPALIKSKLSALSEHWAGDDFDSFAAQVDQVRALLEGVIDDIETTAEELLHREEAVYTLQGGDSGEIPYPAPMVGIEGEWSDLVAIHVRPAWWHGDCILMGCDEAERALELAGADPGLATEVREFIEERVGERLSELGALVSPVRLLAAEDAKRQYGSRVEAELAAYQERQAAIDEAIAQKRADQSAELQAFQSTGEERPCPSSADTARMDLQEPVVEHPAAPAPPETTQPPSTVPPSGDGSAVADEAGAEEDAPDWSGGEESASGGLASGGPGGLGPGGTPAGGGAAATAGSTTAGGFTSSTPAPPAGTAAAAGSRAAVMNAASAPPPVRGATNHEDEDEDEGGEDDGRLLNRETGNIWGYVRPKDDPYA